MKLAMGIVLSFGILTLGICLGYNFSDTNDEMQVVDIIRHGIPLALVPNFILSSFFVALYKVAPVIQWYSWFIYLSLGCSMAIIFSYIFENYQSWLMWFLLSIALFFIFYFTISYSLTSVSFVLLSAAFLTVDRALSKKSLVVAFLLGLFMSLSRTHYFIHFPLLLLCTSIILYQSKKSPSRHKKMVVVGSILLSLIIFTGPYAHKISNKSAEYSEWRRFTFGIFNIFVNDISESKTIPKEDFEIVRMWHADDADIVPTKAIADYASMSNFAKWPVSRYIKNITFTLEWYAYQFFLIFALLLIFGYLVYAGKKQKKNFYIFSLCAVAVVTQILVISTVRPVERMNLGMFFCLFCIFLKVFPAKDFADLLTHEYKKKLFLGFVMSILAISSYQAYCNFHYYRAINVRRITHADEMYKSLSTTFADNYKIIGPAFPFTHTTDYIGLKLFHEKELLGVDINVVPGGWCARHPLQTQWLDNKHFKRHYDLTIHPNTILVGQGMGNKRPVRLFLEYYDRHYAPPNCKHVLDVKQESFGFSYAQLSLKC